MSNDLDRRRFVRNSLVVSGGVACSTFEHLPLIANLKGMTPPLADEASTGGPPMGKIGKLTVSRLICGGNLFSGFAHSGNLLYVDELLKRYFTEDRILDTLQICEQSGINTAVLRADEHIVRVIKHYRKERGGKIQWIAQTQPSYDKSKKTLQLENVQLAIDNGAVGAYPKGAIADALWKEGRLELVGEILSFMKRNGLVAGVGSHTLDVPKWTEAQRLDPDFYFKTLNDVSYWSETPSDIAKFMSTVKKPWIAFKVLGAGRMKPPDGFNLAFKMGADFVSVGMYDFQVKEDVVLVKEIVTSHVQRNRSWAV